MSDLRGRLSRIAERLRALPCRACGGVPVVFVREAEAVKPEPCSRCGAPGRVIRFVRIEGIGLEGGCDLDELAD